MEYTKTQYWTVRNLGGTQKLWLLELKTGKNSLTSNLDQGGSGESDNKGRNRGCKTDKLTSETVRKESQTELIQ